MATCPYCAEEVKPAAIVCKHCGRDIEPVEDEVDWPPKRASFLRKHAGSLVVLGLFGAVLLTLWARNRSYDADDRARMAAKGVRPVMEGSSRPVAVLSDGDRRKLAEVVTEARDAPGVIDVAVGGGPLGPQLTIVVPIGVGEAAAQRIGDTVVHLIVQRTGTYGGHIAVNVHSFDGRLIESGTLPSGERLVSW